MGRLRLRLGHGAPRAEPLEVARRHLRVAEPAEALAALPLGGGVARPGAEGEAPGERGVDGERDGDLRGPAVVAQDHGGGRDADGLPLAPDVEGAGVLGLEGRRREGGQREAEEGGGAKDGHRRGGPQG